MTTLIRRTPRDSFADLDSLMRSTFGSLERWPVFDSGQYTPAAEVRRDGDDAVVRVELPGVDVAKDVHVELVDGRLVVHGERRDETTEEGNGRTLREFRYGAFRRSFRLPRQVTSDDVRAAYDAGVLSVRISGVYAGSQPQSIEISTTATPVEVVETDGQEQSDN